MNFEISLLTFFICLIIASLLSRTKAFTFLNNRGSRFETLDGLRGFLALSVFFHHFVITYYWKVNRVWTRPPEDYYQNYGKVGVAIFFMITGFLFISKLLNFKWNVDWFKIYESRLFRIVPIYLFAVASILIIVFHNSDYQLNSSPYQVLKQIIQWVAFHGGVINEFQDTRTIIAGVDWTLKYEWAFYISLPLISLFLSRSSRILNWLLVGFVILIFIFPITFMSFDSSYAILFLVGGLAAFVVDFRFSFSAKVESKLISMLTAALLFGMIFYPNALDFFHIILMSAFFMLVVLGNSVFGLLRLNSAKILGEISYSIYLMHGLVLYVVFTQLSVFEITKLSLDEYSLLMPVVGAIVVLTSSLTFLYIEKPFIDFGRKYKITNFLRSIIQQANKALQRTSR